MTIGAFRHGPQEIVERGVRLGIWIDDRDTREQDLALVEDIRHLGGIVMVIGQKLPEEVGELVLELPDVPSDFQYIIDVIPAQLAAEHFAACQSIDPDSFRVCSYVVETEHGLGVR